jgi:anti-anti-sigma factor
MELTLQSAAEQEIKQVAVEGRITTLDFESGQPNPVEELLGPDWASEKLVLDLKDVPYMDSTGIGWLVGTHRRLAENGGRFVVHSIHPNVLQMLQLLKIGSLLSLVDNQEDALTTMNQNPGQED